MDVPDLQAHEPLHHIRILYAEDVAELRELARLVFTRDGHSIDCMPDGSDALARLTENVNAYDLLITDHHMPRLNGFDLVSAVRRMPFKGKIMVFSSELSPLVAADYRKLGVDRILFKPVYPSFLRQAIAELFPALSSAETHATVTAH